MSRRGDERVARLVELAQAKVREKLGDRPDHTPVWIYRTVVRTVLGEIDPKSPPGLPTNRTGGT